MFYNGDAPFPQEMEARLSDAFRGGGSLPQSLQLDLTVKVYNIDKSANHPILARCESLLAFPCCSLRTSIPGFLQNCHIPWTTLRRNAPGVFGKKTAPHPRGLIVYFLYPHLGHTPFSFSSMPHRGQRSLVLPGS